VVDGDDPDADSMNYPVEFLNRCSPSGLPSHTLAIKVGMPLIILRNIDVENGLCNGTKVYVLELRSYSIKIKTYIGGNEFLIPRINFTSNEGELPFSLRRRQLPVRPAFAMTIHKSQGQTLNYVGVYLNESVFTHGQLYVALSRATDPASLAIAVPLSNSSSTSPTAKNVVYGSVLI
jgi:ATP-dependent exoDNAse (exonuclease V) alpha subunit